MLIEAAKFTQLYLIDMLLGQLPFRRRHWPDDVPTLNKIKKKGADFMSAGALLRRRSKVESNLPRKRSRCYVVGAAERRKKVVERVFVGQVDDRQLRTHFVFISVKHVVMP